jgi:hypothetical protein
MTSAKRPLAEMTVSEFFDENNFALPRTVSSTLGDLIEGLMRYPERLSLEQLLTYTEAIVALVRVLDEAGDSAARAFLDRVIDQEEWEDEMDFLVSQEAQMTEGGEDDC